MEAKKREKELKGTASASILEEEEVAGDLERQPVVQAAEVDSPSVSGPDLVVPGEDVVMSDDEDSLGDKLHYMTVNGKQVISETVAVVDILFDTFLSEKNSRHLWMRRFGFLAVLVVMFAVDTIKQTGVPPFNSFVLMRVLPEYFLHMV
jgi:hypothetical protein